MTEEFPPRSGARQFPRNLFFQAVDMQVGPNALPDVEVKVIATKRLASSRRLIFQMEKLISSVKAVEAFDLMGNAALAEVNLTDLALDVEKQVRNFSAEVAEAHARYREINEGGSPSDPEERSLTLPEAVRQAYEAVQQGINEVLTRPYTPPHSPVAVEPSPQAPATGPKPGPHLASVVVFDPSKPPKEELDAFDRAAAGWRRTGSVR